MATSSSSQNPQNPPSKRVMINKFIDTFREQGFLDNNFNNQVNLHQNHNSLVTFCKEVDENLDSVKKSLEMETVDCLYISQTMDSIRSNSARIGGRRLSTTCGNMAQICRSNERNIVELAKEAFKKVTWEYYVLRDVFHHVLHVENAIHHGAQ